MSNHEGELIEITVVLRSYNDADLLPRTLKSLDEQQGVKIKLFVFESASTDGSKEIIEQHGYSRIKHLERGSYHSSTVLNQGVEWAETEFVAFVNSDAILLSDDVLLKLVDPLKNKPRCCGSFARQVVREDATVLTRLDHYVAFDHREQLGDKSDHMSLVVSMIRRPCWEKIQFEPSLTYAEDYVWSSQVKAAGFELEYVKEATVEHSHNYSNDEIYRRSYGDAAAINFLSTDAPPNNVLTGAVIPYCKRILRDMIRLYKMGELTSLWPVILYRWYGSLGSWHGERDAWIARKENPSSNQPTIRLK